jgi:hypothetical protein
MNTKRIKLEDCPTCKAKKSIKITFGNVTENGFNIEFKKCTECKNNHSYNSKYELVKYEVVV